MAEIQNRTLQQSDALWKEAQEIILSGCQLYSKGPETHVQGVSPIYIECGQDAHVWDVDGNEYIDYDMGLGPVLFGYCYKPIDDAVIRQMQRGMGFSLMAPEEVEYARLCVEHIPSADMVRFLKTGSEATEAAIRIARAFTGRKHILRGNYHGWHEWTAAAEGVRQGGILDEARSYVHAFAYGDLDEVQQLFAAHKGEIAAVITEAVLTDIPPEGYLAQLKELCHANGALLVIDEVVNGFRFSIGGAQEYFGVTPDLSTFGKATANGMPLSFVAGRREVMETVDPKVFISTTFGGECLSLAAAIAEMQLLASGEVLRSIWEKGAYLQGAFRKLAQEIGAPIDLKGYPCRMQFDYTDYEGRRDWLYNSIFMQECAKRGVLLGWSIFPCYTHTQEDLDVTLNVFEDAMRVYKKALESGNPASYMEGKPLKIVRG